MRPDRALYLYAAATGDCAVTALCGVGDEPVELLAADGLCLATSDVTTADLAAVGDDAADPRLVAALAQRHDSVIRAVAAGATATLPFRLGIVVTDRAAAYRFLAARADALRSGLAAVAGCDEWGVTVHDGGDPSAGHDGGDRSAGRGGGDRSAGRGGGDPSAGRDGDGPGRPESGTAYLLRRRRHFDRIEQRRRTGLELVAATEAALGGVAEGMAPGRREGSLLLDRAYLVRRSEQPRFVEVLDRYGDRLAADGFALRVTGPWPPYSFVPDLTVAAYG